MSSLSLNVLKSSAKVASSVRPFPCTCPGWATAMTLVSNPVTASVACAPPITASAAARVIRHNKTGMFRLVICEFLLDFRKCGVSVLELSRTADDYYSSVCQEWTGTKSFSFGQSSLTNANSLCHLRRLRDGRQATGTRTQCQTFSESLLR